MKIKLENGQSVEAYRSSLRNTYINSDNCKTEYKETGKNTNIYKVIKQL